MLKVLHGIFGMLIKNFKNMHKHVNKNVLYTDSLKYPHLQL